MGNLSKNFSDKEFKCPCCGKFIFIPSLIAGLQELRDKIGKSITINSSTRCSKHNTEVGGKSNSQHLSGKAADIKVFGMTPEELYKFADTVSVFHNGGIGIYNTFVHVDVRNARARWDYRS